MAASALRASVERAVRSVRPSSLIQQNGRLVVMENVKVSGGVLFIV